MPVPLDESDGIRGGLNLYGRVKEGFDGTHPELISLLSTRASVAIKNATVHLASKKLIDELNEAIKTRELIGEAKGS